MSQYMVFWKAKEGTLQQAGYQHVTKEDRNMRGKAGKLQRISLETTTANADGKGCGRL